MNRFHILDLPVHPVTMSFALQFIDDRVRSVSSPAYIVCANPEKIYQVRSVVWLRSFFEAADLVIPDGIGIVIAARLLYGRKLTRVAGADLMQAICAVAPARNYRIFIYGSSEVTNSQAVEILRQRHPGIDIVGFQHGYFPPEKMDDLISRINDARPDILFVGLGSPRQEMWIQHHLPELRVKVIQGIGGSLDVVAGRVKRAPAWLRAAGMEWLYRLLCQPSRIWRQLQLTRFAWEVIVATMRSRLLSLGGRLPQGPT
jgi:N-acetylglucosaminyldiphosphoundecaprenol N-acetyl-beta-D-mannosaminyltransferase